MRRIFRGYASAASPADARSRSGHRYPDYAFILVEAQWAAARWSIGVIGMIIDGIRPARVADSVIDDIRARERNGLVELPRPPGLQQGDRVRILTGPFADHLAIFAGMKPRERIEVLLSFLGASNGLRYRRAMLRRSRVRYLAPLPRRRCRCQLIEITHSFFGGYEFE